NAQELLDNGKIQFGCVADGSTHKFFLNSSNPTYNEMGKVMTANPSVMVSSNEEGEKRVKQGDYAFFMESPSIQYKAERDCDMTQIGDKSLDSKSYAIAVKKNSTYLRDISKGVLYLQESGILASLYDKWWKEKRGGGACLTPPPPNLELGIANVGGVFIVLIKGFVVTILLAFLELLYKIYRKEYGLPAPQLTFWQKVKKELKFAFDFKVKVKECKKASSSTAASEKGSISIK
ncbi:glutamate receptor ionotropic: kainate 2-like protein, partial [Leptotrombidium deliense]